MEYSVPMLLSQHVRIVCLLLIHTWCGAFGQYNTGIRWSEIHGMDNFKIRTRYLTARNCIRHEQWYTNEFYVHGTMHLSNTSFIKYQRDATRTRPIQWKEGGPPHNTVHMDIQPTLYPDSPYTYGQKQILCTRTPKISLFETGNHHVIYSTTTHHHSQATPLSQRFSNFFKVGTTFISQNVLRTYSWDYQTN